jgi:hypothetical protein
MNETPDLSNLPAASLRILAIDHLGAQANGLVANLDSPSQGDATSGPSIFVTGWAIAPNGQANKVSIRVRNRRALCHRFPRPDLVNLFGERAYDAAGFFSEIWACNIYGTQEVEIVAEVDDGHEHSIAKLSVQAIRRARPELLGIPETALKTLPGLLTVNSLGRSGTSLLMSRLLRHPRIGGYAIPPYEARLVLRAALQAKFSISCVRPHFYMQNSWYSDYFTTLDSIEDKIATEEMRQILIQSELSRLANVVMDYRSFLEKKSGRQITLICEKSIGAGLADFISWFWPRYKSVILVRDLRDMLCSYVAFDRKRGISEFSDGLHRNADAYFTTLTRYASALIDVQTNKPDDTLVVRYEDLVLNLRPTLTNLFEFCEVENSLSIIEACVKESKSDRDFQEIHATSSNPQLSIGRWRNDLNDGMLAFYEEHLRTINAHFGYV